MWLKLAVLFVFAFAGCKTTSFDLRGVIHGNRMAGVPLGITLGAGEIDVEGICTQTGVACQNCTHSVTCVSLPVGWLKVPLEECSEGTTCNAHLGGCSEQAVPECDVEAKTYQHTCEQVGIFPDAHDCRKFHLCSPPEGMPDGRPADHRSALCPRHYGYNPQTAQCSVVLTNGQCTQKPVTECTQIGQHGVLPASTNHYYVCLIKNGNLYPQVFICPHGWHFWGSFCRPEPQVTTADKTADSHSSEVKSSEVKSSEVKSSEVNSSEVNSSEAKSSEVNSSEEAATTEVIRPTTTKIEGFFSTEKSTTYAADTFLADKYDLSNYETIDDVGISHDEFANSFESGNDFW